MSNVENYLKALLNEGEAPLTPLSRVEELLSRLDDAGIGGGSVDRDEVEEIIRDYISTLPPSSGGGTAVEETDMESIQRAIDCDLIHPILFNGTYVLTLNDEVMSL